jgi:transcriptional regulator with XRE-family HTH domain
MMELAVAQENFPNRVRCRNARRAWQHPIGRGGHTDVKPEPGHEAHVGNALRALRTKRDLSIRALAEKSGLAVNTLSLIENEKTSPSVATLQQLAVALDVPITAFFENGSPKNRVAYIKASQRSGAAFAHGTLDDLSAGLTDRTVAPFVVTMKPNTNSGTQPIVHTGHEFVFCLEGRIVYTIEDQTYLLEPGDSLLFESHLPHRWQNVEAAPARALLVLCPIELPDQPTQRHFLPEMLQQT